MARALLAAAERDLDSRPEVIEAHLRLVLGATRYWCARAGGEPVGLLSLGSKRFDVFTLEAGSLGPLLGVAVEAAREGGQTELRVNTGWEPSPVTALLGRSRAMAGAGLRRAAGYAPRTVVERSQLNFHQLRSHLPATELRPRSGPASGADPSSGGSNGSGSVRG